jgi:hypothetical protein
MNIIEVSLKKGLNFGCDGIFGGKKKVIGITCGQSQETLRRRAGLAYQTQTPQAGVPA